MTEEKKKYKREISAGGLVYKKEDGQIFVLLIMPSGQTANKDKVWTLPKGHLDKDKAEDAAVREVREEAGVEAKIVENLGSYKYTFVWEGENIFKIVTYYLMEYVSGNPKDHDWEVEESKWFELEEGRKNLTYKIDKEVFKKAEKILTNG
jgi:8-oxo-dGTP diphosphatase